MQKELAGFPRILVQVVAVFSSLYHLYVGMFGLPEAYFHRVTHVFFMVGLALLLFRFRSRSSQATLSPAEWAMFLLWVAAMAYPYYDYTAITERMGYVSTFLAYEKILAILAVGLTLEACRRTVGWPLPALVLLFLVYPFVGPYLPGLLFHQGYTLDAVTDNQYFLMDGLFGLPTHISSTYIFLFIVFGAFLEKSGFGKFVIDLALALTSGVRGGPAQAAVVSSGLVGSISGSSTANAVITGSFTIPMMIRTGIKPHMAAAIEAAASSGGLIMPPVMASVGFLMAEYTGIPYVQIMKLILLPATLYFISVGFMTYLYARKEGIEPYEEGEGLSLWTTLKEGGHLFVPLVVLVYLLVKDYSPMFAVTYCIVAIVIVSALRRGTRMGLSDIWDALVDGSVQAVVVSVAIIASSVMVGIFDLTGIAVKFTSLVVQVSGSNLALGLVLTMVGTIIMGMALPLSSAYIIQVGITIPALINLGVSIPAAHLFVIFFCAFAPITPPTAPTTYAAAGIAKADIIPTAIEAFKLAMPAFIFPYIFIKQPALLMEGAFGEVAGAIVTALIGVVFLSFSIQGYSSKRLGWMERLMFLAGGILLIDPRMSTNIAGLALGAGAWIWGRAVGMRATAAEG